MTSEKMDRNPLVFYGWYVLGASFLVLFFNGGARFSIGVIFKPMIAEFGWTRSSISLAFFLNMALYALSLTIVGRFYDRYGPKWVIIISTVFLSLGYVLIAFTRNTGQFLVYYGVISAIGMGGTSVPIFATLTSKWFKKGRGLAISLALAGSSVGQFLLVPLLTFVVVDYGWRTACIAIGVIMLGVNILLAIKVLKGDPDSFGLRPYGESAADESSSVQSILPSSEDLNLREALRTRVFWFYLVVMLICGSGDFLVSTHLIPLVTDHGISPTRAGNMLAWCGLMSLAGMLVAGPAADRIGNKIPIALTFLLRVLLFLMLLKYKTVFSFYLFALLFGFTFLITAPLTPMLMARIFGLSHLGILSGFITTVHHLAGGFWAYSGGVLFDKTGNYQLIFLLSAAMAFIAFISTLFIQEKRQSKPHRTWSGQ